MASRFIGRFEHSLDAKGRIVLPSRFRGHFDTRAFVTQFVDGCLAVLTPDEFEVKSAAMREREELSPDDRNLVRVWAGTSSEVEIDRQGRLAVTPALRTFAQLGTNVLVMGALERIELWNPDIWEQRVRPAESALLDPPRPAAVG